MKINKGKQSQPRRVLLYGEGGIGKSTFAAGFPEPFFLNIEDGLGDIDCSSTDRIKEFGEFVSSISWLISNEHPYRTVVIDTADWLERLIFTQVAKDHGKDAVEAIGYGKGYEAVAVKWRFVIDGLTHLWKAGAHIVFTSHVKISKFANPEGESYNYYAPALDDRGSEIVQEWCDEVLFAKTRVHVLTKEEGFGQKRSIAIGGKERIIVTNEGAAQVAKNRLGLPDEIPLSFAAFSKYLPQAVTPATRLPRGPDNNGNIAGVVIDGSSKVQTT